jgi:hypothetical protein
MTAIHAQDNTTKPSQIRNNTTSFYLPLIASSFFSPRTHLVGKVLRSLCQRTEEVVEAGRGGISRRGSSSRAGTDP